MMTIASPDPATFHPLVWEIVRQVPNGKVSTYGQIASIIPPLEDFTADEFKRLAPKWVGDALNAVSFPDIDGKPVAPGVPWWRVINSKGGISMPRGSNAAHQQRLRLIAEGVMFDARGLVSLDEFGWEGPEESWLDQRGLLKPKPLNKPNSPRQMSLF